MNDNNGHVMCRNNNGQSFLEQFIGVLVDLNRTLRSAHIIILDDAAQRPVSRSSVRASHTDSHSVTYLMNDLLGSAWLSLGIHVITMATVITTSYSTCSMALS
jgi:hypothetical protein